MKESDKELFWELRKKVADYIRKCLQEDPCCKSYEGTWEILCSYPDYFADETASDPPDSYILYLHCYLIGPHRHYEWRGETFREVLERCKRDIDSWTEED